ncbi:P-loop containing nucleoside triphosphate hydrolase protein [Obelidium mucronatum]|nr:P-loop containing nucleoside triphosphate hydrolase protein [Obelidium mucronatum]
MPKIQSPASLLAAKQRIKSRKMKSLKGLKRIATGSKKEKKAFVFSEDPKDWIPSDDEDDDDEEVDETVENEGDVDMEQDQKPQEGGIEEEDDEYDANEYNDPDAIPIAKLNWNEVTNFKSSDFFGGKDGEGGFLCLEELDGVDVEVVENKSGSKMIKFKAVDPSLAKKKSTKRATPEVPFSAEETAAKFINIDDFDESKVIKKPSTVAPVVEQVSKKTQGVKKPDVASTPLENAKPLNKRERAALKRAQAQAEAAGLPIPLSLPPKPAASKNDTPESAAATVTAIADSEVKPALGKSPHSAHVSSQIHGAWNQYRLHPAVLRALTDMNFTTPTDIQIKSLGAALDTTRKGNGSSSGRDVIGAAATGSGKTLAFGLPVVQVLAKRDEADGDRILRPCTALIMTPTRELAMQVTEHLKAVAKYTTAKIIPVVGGMSLHKQRRVLSHSPDIIVATPGRLWELAENDAMLRASLKCVKFLILDEADRMLEAGHFRDLENILNAVSLNRQDDDSSIPNESFVPPTSRQTFVFSATLLPNPSALSKKLASNKPEKETKNKKGPATNLQDFLARLELNPHPEGPIYIQALTKSLMASGLTEARIEVLDEDKDAVVYYLLTRYPNGRTIVFVNSIDMVRRLCPVLQVCKIDAIGLHSEMQQRQRLRNLDKFRSSSIGTVLIATDVAARGLDIPSVEHVIHFHLPRTTDLYVHRSGRTARAMREGMSVALVGPAEVGVYKKICHALGKEDGIIEFPMDRSILALIKSRLSLAKRIEAAEHKTDKKKHDKDWMKKAAEECDIILDDSDEDQEVVHRNKKITRETTTPSVQKGQGTNQSELASMKARLEEMLSKPILPMGISAAYVTSSANRSFANDMLATEGSTVEGVWKGNKKTRAVDDVDSKKKKIRVRINKK